MKKIILILFLLSALGGLKSIKAQITFEHAYDSAYANLYIVNLEVEGMKYAKRGHWSTILYNLDHSLFKIMPLPTAPNGVTNWFLLYISEHLFNTNDSIEYMYGYTDTKAHFYILSESGNVIFYKDSLVPQVLPNAPQTQVPIYNTPDGTKMIVSVTGSLKANVYGLGGTLTNAIQPVGTTVNLEELSIFPNPSHENTTIDFALPSGVNTADVVLFDLNGTEIKRYKVDNTFNNLILNNGDLKSGTYLYELVAANQTIGFKKMIVIK